MSGNQSPLLALFWLASQNTDVDDPDVLAAFQPIHTVVPPASVDRYIAPTNQNYMNALMALQNSLDQMANLPGPANDQQAAPTLGQANAAKLTTRQMAQAFRIDPQAHIETTAQKLLEDPIAYVEGLLRQLGPAELNAKGKALCGQWRALMAKYPFNPAAQTEATHAGGQRPVQEAGGRAVDPLRRVAAKAPAEAGQPVRGGRPARNEPEPGLRGLLQPRGGIRRGGLPRGARPKRASVIP